VIIVKVSQLTGKTHSREIDVTQDQLNEWEAGAVIQRVMPHLSDSDREFLITGATQAEWDETFKEVEEDDTCP
jgi:hypothetical protein